MSNIGRTAASIYSAENFSRGASVIHALDARAKIIATLCYIGCVVSFPSGAAIRLFPFFAYPAAVLWLAKIPFAAIFKRSLAALPFCVFAGLSPLLFERTVLFCAGPFPVTNGIMIFLSLVIRTFLCTFAALILIAVTPFREITSALSVMRMPKIFVMLFEMTYRFIALLTDDAMSMSRAYTLRSGMRRVKFSDMGTFVGQLLLRSCGRAERVYSAMKCRGYGADVKITAKHRDFCADDRIFIIIVCGASILFRFADLSGWIWGLM